MDFDSQERERRMTITEAGFLLARLLLEEGHDPRMVDQIDFVPCEDGTSMMAYAYLKDSNEPWPVCFDLIGQFDRERCEAALLPDTRRMH